MKWRNHKVVTFAVVFSMAGGFIAALSAMIGAVLPDVLEFKIVKHRTITHYLFLWLFLFLVLWLALRETGFSSLPLYVAVFVVSGGLLHVLQDALSCEGIPIFKPYGRRYSLGLFQTGSVAEEFTTAGLLILFAAFSWKRGFLTTDHFSGQVKLLMNLLTQ